MPLLFKFIIYEIKYVCLQNKTNIKKKNTKIINVNTIIWYNFTTILEFILDDNMIIMNIIKLIETINISSEYEHIIIYI